MLLHLYSCWVFLHSIYCVSKICRLRVVHLKVSALFGLFSSIAVIIMGDQSGLYVYHAQPSKLVAIEGIWNTEQAPVSWSVLAYS